MQTYGPRMIQSYVVHLVVNVDADHDLVGMVEDVQTGERRRFLGPEELVAHLIDLVPGDTNGRVGGAASPPSPTEL